MLAPVGAGYVASIIAGRKEISHCSIFGAICIFMMIPTLADDVSVDTFIISAIETSIIVLSGTALGGYIRRWWRLRIEAQSAIVGSMNAHTPAIDTTISNLTISRNRRGIAGVFVAIETVVLPVCVYKSL